jgi:uncharacterized coiled-coil DUF342 family protein
MSSRQKYIDDLKVKLDEWNAEITRLEAKAQAAQADMKAEYNRQVETLKERQRETQQRMEELQTSSESAWEDMKAGVESAWHSMEKAIEDARARFSG